MKCTAAAAASDDHWKWCAKRLNTALVSQFYPIHSTVKDYPENGTTKLRLTFLQLHAAIFLAMRHLPLCSSDAKSMGLCGDFSSVVSDLD